MARFVREVVLNKPGDFVQFIMDDYLRKNGFVMSNWKGEPAYRAGDAAIEGYKYLKWGYMNGVFHLEAWMKGTFGGEWNLDGFVGTLQKKPYKESLEQLFGILQQPLPHGGQVPQGVPIPVQTLDNTGAANLALVFGILAIVVGYFIPIIGILLGCLGFSRARMGGGSSKAGIAKAGKVLSIIGIIVSLLSWALNFMLVMGML
ncbi:MAG: hypothetical protein HFH11_12640 [Dorea sp.]|nr:hypothetical protein [Dorea sp.]